jgi:ribA/ribD-fused uncharacterized protein
MAIDSFRGHYGFLSNFSVSPIVVEGQLYATVEHAFQAHKTDDCTWHEAIRIARTPALAKGLGRKCPKRADWDEQRVAAMRYFLKLKFADPVLRDKLKRTAPNELVEGNTWGDTFWGVCRGVGENMLGKLLMEIRDAT